MSTGSAAPAEQLTKSAWLEKKGEVNPSWKKRWFDLKNSVLEYRKQPSDVAPKGVINLTGCRARIAPGKGSEWQHRLEIEAPAQGRTYFLRGQLTQLQDWLAAIQHAGCAASTSDPFDEDHASDGASTGRPSDRAGSESEADVSSPMAPPPMPHGQAHQLASAKRPGALFDGYLQKKGEQRRAWRWRWMELHQARLDYFASPSDSRPRGSVLLKQCHLELGKELGSTADLGLTMLSLTPLAGDRIFKLRSDAATIKTWHDKIQQCVDALDKREKERQKKRLASGDTPLIERGKVKQSDPVDQGVAESSPGRSRHDDDPPQQQTQQQVSASLRETQDYLAQREQAVAKLESDVTQINTMFKDVNNLVQDQGGAVDALAARVHASAEGINAGVASLDMKR